MLTPASQVRTTAEFNRYDRASAAQAGKLAGWAAARPQRTWAVEGAGGLGHLLARQLVAAGERVDVTGFLVTTAELTAGSAIGGARSCLTSRCRRPL
jgi:D-arabinose 1-dehydrogenase-like Zn-dependent alcohol dehydrogenase